MTTMKDKMNIIETTIEILDSYNSLYRKISGNKYDNYADYISKSNNADEEELMKTIFRSLLENVLGFPRDEYIPEERGKAGQPDFQPIDKRTHNFLFEIKGSDTQSLHDHFEQLNRYVYTPVKWGIITNMRDVTVYEPPLQVKIPDYSFSFLQLYWDFQNDRKNILELSNTKRLLNFVERFSYHRITIQEKIELVKSAPSWTGDEILDIDELTIVLRDIVGHLKEDVKNEKGTLDLMVSQTKMYREDVINIGSELEEIATEIDRGRDYSEKVTLDSLNDFLNAKIGTTEYKALEVYMARIAYFTMTRVLIARIWEDIGFIEQSLYDGGFTIWYNNFNEQMGRVLKYAFNLAGEKYSWLFTTRPNNYSWYEPSDKTIVDVLYALSSYNLGKLDTDVLGYVYEEFIEKLDKKNKGQYYTPREMISFIWDRVGYLEEDDIFVFENGNREVKRIFDPAAGSGGFLVEAMKRIRERSTYNKEDFESILKIFLGMVESIHGSEISVFAYYITEVNLLIQITKVMKQLLESTDNIHKSPPFILQVVPLDSLGLVRNYNAYIKEEGDVREQGTSIIDDQYKQRIYKEFQEKDDFDYVCANPPYIGEKGHKELFQHTIRKYPFWKEYYQGRMDYLYWFIILGLLKLKEEGKLGFITTRSWLEADGASILREFILKNALIKEIIYFGEVRIFDNAPGQNNIVFVLEKCSNIESEEKAVRKEINENIAKKNESSIKIVQVKKELEINEEENRLGKLLAHIEANIDKKEYSDNYIDVYWSGATQGELDKNSWSTRLVKISVQKVFDNLKGCKPLSDLLDGKQGVVPNPDKVIEKVISKLSREVIASGPICLDDGVFILDEEELNTLSLQKEEYEIIYETYANSDIGKYIVDRAHKSKSYIIYLTDNVDINNPIYRRLKTHLEKFRGYLLERREVVEGRRNWYSLHWPRTIELFQSEKIVVSNWGTSWQPFAYQTGDFFEKRDITIFVKKINTKESLFYLLGLLNSKLLKVWMINKARQLGYMRQSIQNQIPLRPIAFTNKKDVIKHDRIVTLVNEIIEQKKELSEYNSYYTGKRLTAYTQDDEVSPLNLEEVTLSLPKKSIRTLRNNPDVQFDFDPDFYLTSIGEVSQLSDENEALFENGTNDLAVLILKGKERKNLRIISRFDILGYLQSVLVGYKREPISSFANILVPKDFKAFNEKKQEISNDVEYILDRVFAKEEEIDKIVYDLYDLSKSQMKLIENEIRDE